LTAILNLIVDYVCHISKQRSDASKNTVIDIIIFNGAGEWTIEYDTFSTIADK
jgi:hypothetical protein